jgi:branched-subunit amino acid aminotransferase/4-amino-4-deoxychorismate lyase
VVDLRFRWNGSDLIPVDGASILPLYVADSWLLTDGSVVALERHFDRFASSATAQGLVRSVDTFAAAVTAALPRVGSFFPRIDLTERGELELWIRAAPPLGDSAVLATADTDVRTEPTIKGPDIPALEQLRQTARLLGADDAVIVNAAGKIIDGATTCLLWWRDGQIFVPPAEALRVDSVTVRVVTEIATAQGIPVHEEWSTPAQLEDTTVWALNSLHGIRQVTAWINGPELVSDLSLLHTWREFYEALSTPLAEV